MTSPPRQTRTGWGFDAHRIGGDPPILLGGVPVDEGRGVVATSDGDVVAHAVVDALLGACVLGDIGSRYPSEDPGSAGADSMSMLRAVHEAGRSSGWSPTHVDVTVIAEQVRVAPHRDAIRSGLAGALGLTDDRVSVKATTTDGLGLIGSGEGIAAVAVVTVEQA
jgi:2-C-methyl-D-erythritol 2,4-cyclodiphosphate synthase